MLAYPPLFEMMESVMISRIPSWAVAVTGALIVIMATAISAIMLHGVRQNVEKARSEITDERRKIDRLWSNHRQADQRATTADIFFAEALGEKSNTRFLLDQAAAQLRGAVLSMWAASGQEVPDDTPKNIETLEGKLRQGDLSAYSGLQSEINRLRLLSASYINQVSSSIHSGESRIETLEARQSAIYLAYVFFNLFGLIVTTCKDLPVWSDLRAEVRT